MSADLVELSGYLFAAWGVGYLMGLLIYAFRRFADFI